MSRHYGGKPRDLRECSSVSEKLLPCPFCGGTRLMVTDSPCPYHESGRAYTVSCTTRDCHGAIYALGYDLFRTPDEAVAAWNERTPVNRSAVQ